MAIVTQSPEADLDRELEELIGKAMRGTFAPEDQARLVELQSRRSRLMRPSGNFRRSTAFGTHRYAG